MFTFVRQESGDFICSHEKKEQINSWSTWVFLQKGRFLKKPVSRRFSYAGSKISLIRKRCKSNHSKFYVIKGFHTYGNYLTYVRKSADIMKEPSIRMQLRRVSSLLRKKMRIAQNKANIITDRKLITEYMKYGHTYH